MANQYRLCAYSFLIICVITSVIIYLEGLYHSVPLTSLILNKNNVLQLRREKLVANALTRTSDLFETRRMGMLPTNPWNSSNTGTMGVTSAKTSYFTLISPEKNNIIVGEEVHIGIIARDGNGRLRVGGGDFWSAIISTEKNPQASTTGKVIDYDNGTYSMYFVASWAGLVTVNISLVHTSDAATFLKNHIWNEQRVQWAGVYTVGNKQSNTSCFLITSGLTTWSNMCEYPNSKALGKSAFMCERRPGFACSSLTHSGLNEVTKKQIKNNFKQLIKGYEYLFDINQNETWLTDQNLYSSKYSTLRIYTKGEKRLLPAHLPPCGMEDVHKVSEGYWYEGSWTSLRCKKATLNIDYFGSCMRGKEIYLLGDSNLKQWFKILSNQMSVSSKDNGKFVQVYSPTYNFTLTFRFHKFKLALVYSNDLFEYEIEVLDGLRNAECNYVIVFDPAFHFTQWSREAYRDILLHLRTAAMTLLAKCPHVPIVFKGPHPRDMKYDIYLNLSISNYLLYEMIQLARHIFSETGVYFLDTWDMGLSYPGENEVHMPLPEVEEEVAMFLSYACGAFNDD